MSTAIDSSIPQDAPQEEIHDEYGSANLELNHKKEAEEAEHAVSSPYSDIQDPNDLPFTQRLSLWSPQPASPSSVNTSESTMCRGN
jgi:hypothetical protein